MKKLAKKERTIRRQAPQHLVTAHEKREGYQLVWSRNAPSSRHTPSGRGTDGTAAMSKNETSQQQKALMPPKSRRKKDEKSGWLARKSLGWLASN
jgi:hypothetical protein